MIRPTWFLPLVLVLPISALERPPLPVELAAYVLEPAPETTGLILKKGDRLAICGDSITEQKQYSALLETYLTACLPELEITSRQYGWSGEAAGGFLKRMRNDVLRFAPTIATTCYGMNDFRYVPYDEGIAAEFRKNQTAIVDAFQESGCRVVLGSPGIIDSVPHWVKSAKGTQLDLNLSLSRFRNIGVEIARTEKVAFADLYRPMLLADHAAKKRFGPDFKVAGGDGVHPDWAGQVVMAYGFLKALGVDGVVAIVMRNRNPDRLAGHIAFGKGRPGRCHPQTYSPADKLQPGVAHQHAGQKAHLGQDLKAVADAKYIASARRMGPDCGPDRRLRGNRPATQIVAKGKSAGHRHQIDPIRQACVLVPDAGHIATGAGKRYREITVAVRAGECDDGGFHGRHLC